VILAGLTAIATDYINRSEFGDMTGLGQKAVGAVACGVK
jgi:hypothetical protein